MAKQQLTAEEKAAKKAERKAKFKEMNKKNSTKWQAFKYLCCTASAGLIQFISFTIMTYAFAKLDWGQINFITWMPKTTFVATTVALALSVLWNFTLNRKFTFKSAKNVPVAMFLAFLFYVPFYPFQTWYVHAVGVAIGGTEIASLVAEATVMLINGVLEFCWQKFFIYRKSANTAGAAKIADDARVIETTCYNPLNGKKFGNDTFAPEDMEIVENDLVKVDLDKKGK